MDKCINKKVFENEFLSTRQNHDQHVPTAQSIKLLIVEDNFITQKVIEEMLSNLGCCADFAEDGKTALAMYCSRYQLILIDIELPDFTGIEVAKTIRKIENKQNASHVPIIAITSHYGEPKYKKSCIQAGMDSSNKPDLMRLKEWISEYVDC